MDFSVIVLPGSFASAVAVTLDALDGARLLAPQAGARAPRWRVLSPAGGEVRLSMGLSLSTQRLPQRAAHDASVWVLPGLRLPSTEQLQAHLEAPDMQVLARAVQRHVARGGRVAASCFSVFVLALAGVLDGRCATTTWWLAQELARRFPACRVESQRMVCVDGPVITAAAAMAQTDLMLHLLREYGGYALADWVSRAMLIDSRSAQSTYVIPQVLMAGDDALAHWVEWIESRLAQPITIGQWAAFAALSPKTLSRRVRQATGQSPMAVIQSVRLRRARHLLETTRLPMDAVAQAVGYQDATALRRLLRRAADTTPGQLRRMGPHIAQT